MKTPQQYDEMKIREHYNSLKDSGMDETQIETDMMYDSPFDTENVQAFFNDQKKKEDPSLSGGIQLLKNKASQVPSELSYESLGGTAPSQSLSESPSFGSDDQDDVDPIYLLPSAEAVEYKDEATKRFYKRLDKMKQKDWHKSYESVVNAPVPGLEIPLTEEHFNKAGFPVTSDMEGMGGNLTVSYTDVVESQLIQELLLPRVRSQYPAVNDRLARLENQFDDQDLSPEQRAQIYNEFQHVKVTATEFYAREALGNALRNEYSGKYGRRALEKIERNLYYAYDRKINLSGDYFIGKDDGEMSAMGRWLKVGWQNFGANLHKMTDFIGITSPEGKNYKQTLKDYGFSVNERVPYMSETEWEMYTGVPMGSPGREKGMFEKDRTDPIKTILIHWRRAEAPARIPRQFL